MVKRFLVVIALVTTVILPNLTLAGEGPVWHWFSQCQDAREIEIQLLLDGKPFYDSRFPACHLGRSDIKPESPQKILKFAYPGTGNKRLGASSSEKIEGNIWEAGSDPDDILLGVSLSGPKQVWLNTLYLVRMEGTHEMELEKGVVMKSTVKDAERSRP